MALWLMDGGCWSQGLSLRQFCHGDSFAPEVPIFWGWWGVVGLNLGTICLYLLLPFKGQQAENAGKVPEAERQERVSLWG